MRSTNKNFLTMTLYHKWIPVSIIFATLFFFSCNKQKVEPVEVYPPSPTALVKFLDGGPFPAIGSEGSVVKFNVSGLKGKEGQFKFFINQMEAEVILVEPSAITVKIPIGCGTGAAAVLINGEYYFGPTFFIKGKISIDPSFNPDAYGSNGEINGIFLRADNTSYFLYGRFSNYQSSATATDPVTSMAIVDLNGSYLAVANQMKRGKTGVSGSLNSVIQMPDGRYLLAGSFGSYDTTSNLNNITRLTSTGVMETQLVDILNPDPVNNPDDNKAFVPLFNGGTIGEINRMFYNSANGYVIVIGNFTSYLSTFYERSTKTGPFLDIIKIKQLIRMKANGEIDSTFNFKSGLPQENGNGYIYDAVQQPDGKIIIAGNFTSFNGITVNYVTRINGTDGSLDATFNQGGAGADGSVDRITYNTTTGKILLTGTFKNFNGQPANGVVMLTTTGSVDPSFRFGKLTGGVPTYAAQLNNGRVIVAGSFNQYNYNYQSTPDKYITRPGFMVLESSGDLAAGYNNTGMFRGKINSMLQIMINGVPGAIFVGNFDRFDGKSVSNIVKVRIEN